MARAIKQSGSCSTICGVGRNAEILEQALAEGVIDSWSQNPEEYCKNADLIIIGVPGLSVSKVLEDIERYLEEKTVLTDVASVKSSTVEAVQNKLGSKGNKFVPGHPIAGSEQSGFFASRVDLFKNKRVILTPLPENDPEDVELLKKLWQKMDAEVIEMKVDHHDEVLAATSHLPHLLAFALVDTLSQHGESEEIFRYAAGGFRDFTRIASSDPVMWRDIFLANGEPTIKILDDYMDDLKRLRSALENKEGEYFLETFSRAKQSRDKFMKLHQKIGVLGKPEENQ